MVILYEVHNNLYVNMTNQCPCSCVFCLRQTKQEMNHSGSLWLEREPTVEEVKQEFSKFLCHSVRTPFGWLILPADTLLLF